ncbi:Maf family protein [Tundrisphaera lichenicola]|uniref:Maf family protein n=1 Tax=Tundrisphaera lichenicola TaxID=2029860 RepID=UPI003EB90B1B
MPLDLILASTSPYRRAQVERLGVPFRAVAPPVDEESLKREWGAIPPRELAERLAMAKAEGVARQEPDAVVIGGDQLVASGGSILGKPGTPERAVEQLMSMSGRSHELITALVVIQGGTPYAHTNITRLALRQLTHEEIRRYVEADCPTDCAGAYKLEARGIALFDRIDSEDHSAIVGVPMIALTTILRRLGFAIP